VPRIDIRVTLLKTIIAVHNIAQSTLQIHSPKLFLFPQIIQYRNKHS